MSTLITPVVPNHKEHRKEATVFVYHENVAGKIMLPPHEHWPTRPGFQRCEIPMGQPRQIDAVVKRFNQQMDTARFQLKDEQIQQAEEMISRTTGNLRAHAMRAGVTVKERAMIQRAIERLNEMKPKKLVSEMCLEMQATEAPLNK